MKYSATNNVWQKTKVKKKKTQNILYWAVVQFKQIIVDPILCSSWLSLWRLERGGKRWLSASLVCLVFWAYPG